MDEDEYNIDSGSEQESICPAPAIEATRQGKQLKIRITSKKPETQKTRPKTKKGHLASLPEGPLHQVDDPLHPESGEQPMESLSTPDEGERIQLGGTSPVPEKELEEHLSNIPEANQQSDDPSPSADGEQPMVLPDAEGDQMQIESLSLDGEKEVSTPPQLTPYSEPYSPRNDDPSPESLQPLEEAEMVQLEPISPDTENATEDQTPIDADGDSPISESANKMPVDCQAHIDEGERIQLEALAADCILLPDLRKLDEYNVVMFIVDSLNNEAPPTPKPPVASPDTKFYGVDDFVDLPWDLDYVTEENIQRGLVFRRELKQAAEQGFSCLNDFETLLNRLRTAQQALGLKDYFQRHSDDDEVLAILTLLHHIVKLALRAPELITSPLPILTTAPGREHTSVTLSQEQCAALLACSFLGVIPYGEKQEEFNEFNLSLLMLQRNDVSYQKLCFIFNYFANVICHPPTGVVTFRRDSYSLEKTTFTDKGMYHNAYMSKVGMTRSRIEECPKMLQVDFANKYIGGGVMYSGFVQEEIRFLCCPELMVSMLLCPVMKQNEAITIIGAQQYSNYADYGHETKFRPNVPDSQNQPRDKYKRIMCEVVAIDAVEFREKYARDQFDSKKICREIRKAFAGFYTELGEKRPVATGNWGCGAFNGHLQLKCIVQWIAASMTGRDILYCTFSQEAKISQFCDLVKKSRARGILLGQIYKWLMRYICNSRISLFQYLENQMDQVVAMEPASV